MKGVTLLEMLVVLAVIVLLGAVAAPGFSDLLARDRAQAAASEIYRHLVSARQFAIGSGERATVCGLDNNGQCTRDSITSFTVFADRDRDHDLDADEPVYGRLRLNYSGRIALAARGPRHITFNPNGSARQFSSIYICPAGNRPEFARRVTVSRAGRAYVALSGGAAKGCESL